MANGTYFHDGSGWKPTHSRPPLRRPVVGTDSRFGGWEYLGEAIARLRVNPPAPLDIPTYDGSGQTTHPCVRFFPGGWNGHSWWMAHSPYANSNTELENPCLAYSDDGRQWADAGIPNPLVLPPEEDGAVVGYNSDPHLLLRPDGVMEVWWRTLYQSGNNAGCEVICRRISADGMSWTEREELHRVQNTDGTNIACLCPVALYEDGVYKIWVVYKQECLRYYESSTGADWQHIRDIDVSNPEYSEYKVWHFDINRTSEGYEFVGSYMIPGDYTSHRLICYAVSKDNITYSEPVLILTPGAAGSWDGRLVYRPSIIRLPGRVMIYYGAQNTSLEWHIGQIEAPSAYLFNSILRTGERVDTIEVALAALEAQINSGDAEGLTIVESFEASPWLPGYWKPEENGALTIYGSFCRSQLIPLTNLVDGGRLAEATVVSSFTPYPTVRVNYFDRNLRWIGYDSGERDGGAGGTQYPTPVNWPEGAVYFAVSANGADKSAVTLTIN